MAQILKQQGAAAALAAIRDLITAITPPWQRQPADPWERDAVTVMFGRVPAWMA